jgi:hypothetical protein
MILTYENIKYNLELLEEVKKEYPILQDFEDGKVSRDSLTNVGLDQFVDFISFIKLTSKTGDQKVIYDETISLRELKLKVAELTNTEKVKNIFLKKSKDDFIKVFVDYKVNRRYTRTCNASYCSGLESGIPIIINYFIQNGIDVYDGYLSRGHYYLNKLKKPSLFSRELKMTQDFIDEFINYSKEKDLDLRKCNIKSLTNELNHRLKSMMKIESGLHVKCIKERKSFTLDKLYLVEESRVGYNGFLEVKVTDDLGVTTFIPYTLFEEVSRQRDDIFKELGLL